MRKSIFLMSAALCAFATPAIAQDAAAAQAADAPPAESGEIVVTAQGRAQFLAEPRTYGVTAKFKF